MKKIILIITGFTLTSAVFAGTMGQNCEPGQVTVPCNVTKWDLGIDALYLKPIYGVQRSYILKTNFGDLFRAFENSGYFNDYLDWDWGVRLEASYHFSTGTDITVDWSHIKTDSSIPVNQIFEGFGGFRFTWDALQTNQHFDQVNLVLGQHVDVGLIKDIRFYGGLQYAKFKDNVGITRTVFNPIGNISRDFNFDQTEFSGVGPVLGIDYQYNVSHSVSLIAKSQSSILYGKHRQIDLRKNLRTSTVTSRVANNKGLVPSLEAKVGVNYTYELVSGLFNLQGGYQILNNFNALQGYLPVQTQPSNADFGLYGPYLSAKWVGIV